MTILLAEAPSVGSLLTGWRLLTSLVGVIVVTLVAGRILGTRRSPRPGVSA